MYGYNLAGTPFQHPGPVLCVKQGDTVTITLTNTLTARRVDLVPRPAERARERGTRAAAVLDGGAGTLTSLTNVATADGGTVTYSFVATIPARSCTSRAPIPTCRSAWACSAP